MPCPASPVGMIQAMVGVRGTERQLVRRSSDFPVNFFQTHLLNDFIAGSGTRLAHKKWNKNGDSYRIHRKISGRIYNQLLIIVITENEIMKREKQEALLIIHMLHFYILKLLVRKFQTYTKAETNKRVKTK